MYDEATLAAMDRKRKRYLTLAKKAKTYRVAHYYLTKSEILEKKIYYNKRGQHG